MKQSEEISFFYQVEFVTSFCYLEDRLKASGGREAAVTRKRIGWIKFRKCGELFYGSTILLKTKGRIYQSCVRSTRRYGRRHSV